MRTDAAALGRVTHHQVIEARVRYEAELLQQFGRLRQVMIHTLHQHRPFGFAQAFEVFSFERRLIQLPLAAPLRDQARLRIGVAGQLYQLLGIEQAVELRDGLADEQRFFLPVIAQKYIFRQAAE